MIQRAVPQPPRRVAAKRPVRAFLHDPQPRAAEPRRIATWTIEPCGASRRRPASDRGPKADGASRLRTGTRRAPRCETPASGALVVAAGAPVPAIGPSAVPMSLRSAAGTGSAGGPEGAGGAVGAGSATGAATGVQAPSLPRSPPPSGSSPRSPRVLRRDAGADARGRPWPRAHVRVRVRQQPTRCLSPPAVPSAPEPPIPPGPPFGACFPPLVASRQGSNGSRTPLNRSAMRLSAPRRVQCGLDTGLRTTALTRTARRSPPRTSRRSACA